MPWVRDGRRAWALPVHGRQWGPQVIGSPPAARKTEAAGHPDGAKRVSASPNLERGCALETGAGRDRPATQAATTTLWESPLEQLALTIACGQQTLRDSCKVSRNDSPDHFWSNFRMNVVQMWPMLAKIGPIWATSGQSWPVSARCWPNSVDGRTKITSKMLRVVTFGTPPSNGKLLPHGPGEPGEIQSCPGVEQSCFRSSDSDQVRQSMAVFFELRVRFCPL